MKLECPLGYYCPKASGSPTPCAKGTYSTKRYAPDVTYCIPCGFAMMSDPGATSCTLTLTAKLAIGCGVPGLIFLCVLVFWLVRWYKLRQAWNVAEFERTYLENQRRRQEGSDDDMAYTDHNQENGNGALHHPQPSAPEAYDDMAKAKPKIDAGEKRRQLEERMAAMAAAQKMEVPHRASAVKVPPLSMIALGADPSIISLHFTSASCLPVLCLCFYHGAGSGLMRLAGDRF